MKTKTLLLIGILGYSLASSAQAQTVEARQVQAEATLTLAPLTPENIAQAIARFENTPLPRALTPDELTLVTTRIKQADVYQAGAAARFLANAQQNDAALRVQPILARFKETAKSPLSLPPSGITYISSEACAINLFLLSLSRIEPVPTVVKILEEERQGKTSPRLHQWLTAASGFAGDKSVAATLKTYLEQEPDASLKALLVRAYARSAQEEAIPTLKVLQYDRTVTAYVHGNPEYGIASIAHDELKRLGG